MHYHMLLVCDILSSSTPHPEVNHGRASLPTFSLHTRLDSFTYAHKLIHSITCCPLTTYRRNICWAVYIQNSGWPQEQHCAWNRMHRHTMHSNIVGKKITVLRILPWGPFWSIQSTITMTDATESYLRTSSDVMQTTSIHTPTQNSNDLDLK